MGVGFFGGRVGVGFLFGGGGVGVGIPTLIRVTGGDIGKEEE